MNRHHDEMMALPMMPSLRGCCLCMPRAGA